ncbi:hypothetical protein NXW48_10270 [Phocaeicola vulgatus]|nr:hypothetical protein [Phocaeicola vulgatus]
MNNIYNRYIWLLHTVYQERKVTFERLCDFWKHHFLYNGKPLSLRTFHHHRKMIEENFDIVIACNRKDYTYYIRNWMKYSVTAAGTGSSTAVSLMWP